MRDELLNGEECNDPLEPPVVIANLVVEYTNCVGIAASA